MVARGRRRPPRHADRARPSGRVLRQVGVAPAAHDACVVR